MQLNNSSQRHQTTQTRTSKRFFSALAVAMLMGNAHGQTLSLASNVGVYQGTEDFWGKTTRTTMAVQTDGSVTTFTEQKGADNAFKLTTVSTGKASLAGAGLRSTEHVFYSANGAVMPADLQATAANTVMSVQLKTDPRMPAAMSLSRLRAAAAGPLGSISSIGSSAFAALAGNAANGQDWILTSIGSEVFGANISQSGAITGVSSQGCKLSGQMGSNLGNNSYKIELKTGSSPCQFPNQSWSGLATLTDSQLFISALNVAKSLGLGLVGDKLGNLFETTPKIEGVYLGKNEKGQRAIVLAVDGNAYFWGEDANGGALQADFYAGVKVESNENGKLITRNQLYTNLNSANYSDFEFNQKGSDASGVITPTSTINGPLASPLKFSAKKVAQTDHDINKAASLNEVTGSYVIPFEYLHYNYTISQTGALTGVAGTCTFTGSVVTKSKNYFAIEYRFGSTSTQDCTNFSLAGKAFSGLMFVLKINGIRTVVVGMSESEFSSNPSLSFTTSWLTKAP